MREQDTAFEGLRDAIEAFAGERAPELVAEARAEALARVRSMLTDALAQSLLDRAREELTPTASTPPSARPERVRPPAGRPERAAVTDDDLAHYVYGVTWAGQDREPERLPGVDPGHEATLFEHAGLAAVASRVSLSEFGERELRENLNDVAWLEEKARAHERVLEATLARMTVVPMRLCTIYRSEAQVREMLEREHDAFADALRRLDGRTEWAVKLVAEPGALEQAATGDDDSSAHAEIEPASGADYLRAQSQRARAREEADSIAEDWSRAIHERLAAHSVQARLNPVQNPELSGHVGDMLLNGAYLVDDASLADFRATVDELEREYRPRGAAIELSGPWPPYNFSEGSLEAAG